MKKRHRETGSKKKTDRRKIVVIQKNGHKKDWIERWRGRDRQSREGDVRRYLPDACPVGT